SSYWTCSSGATGFIPSYIQIIRPGLTAIEKAIQTAQSKPPGTVSEEMKAAMPTRLRPYFVGILENVSTHPDQSRRLFWQMIFDVRANPLVSCFWLPTFFTSIWLWLYAGSGFLLKAARRFD